MSKSYSDNPAAPVALSFEAIDELIYDARLGDLDALKAEISKWSEEHNVSAAAVVRSALDTEDESEGGTGASLLHWPAANGNVDLLTYLLHTLKTDAALTPQEYASFMNYRNYTGNTPLHWAALNTHLDCVKALVEAGADLSLKNDAGHDAIFLAERADWSADDDNDGDEENKNNNDNDNDATAEVEIGTTTEQKDKPAPPPTKARQVVEWLLGSEKGAGIETPIAAGGKDDAAEDTQMEDAQ